MTVIGIVGDVHQAHVETPSRAEMYFSYEQDLGIPGYFKPVTWPSELRATLSAIRMRSNAQSSPSIPSSQFPKFNR